MAHRIGAEIHRGQLIVGGRAVVALARADQHVGAVGGEHEFGQRAGEAGAGLDQRHQRARGDVDALEHPLPVVPDLVDQPVRLVGVEEGVVGQHIGAHRRGDLNTSIAISSSLMRRCRIASSSSRATCSGQNDAPCAIMPSISARRRAPPAP